MGEKTNRCDIKDKEEWSAIKGETAEGWSRGRVLNVSESRGVALVGSDSVIQNSWRGLRVGQNVDTSLFGGGDSKAQDM